MEHRELTDAEKEQRQRLLERLRERRALPDDWRDDVGVPHLDERTS